MDGQEAQVDFTIFLAFVFQNPESLGGIRGFMGRKKKTEREKGLRKSRYVTTLPHSIVWGKYRCKRVVSIGAMRICTPLVGNISGKWRDSREDLLM